MTRLFKVVRRCVLLTPVISLFLASVPLHADEDLRTGDWQAICDPQGCRLAHSLVAAQSETMLLMARVFDGDVPTLVLPAPLGSFLKAGLQMSIDGGAPRTLAYEICDEFGCHAGVPLDDGLLRDFKRGLKADIAFADGTQQQVTLSISLVGFTKGMEVFAKGTKE